jgi:DNA-directed RNA polymerase
MIGQHHLPPERRELLLEESMRDQGVRRFNARIREAREQGREASTPHGTRLVDGAIEAVADNIRAFLNEAGAKGRGPLAGAVPILSRVDPRTAAFLTLRVIIDSIMDSPLLGSLAARVGRRLADEVRFGELMASLDPTRKASIQGRAVKATSWRHIRNMAVHFHNVWTEQGSADEYRDFTFAEVIRAGTRAIQAVIEATGYVEVSWQKTGNKTARVIAPTADLTAWINDFNARSEVLTPVNLPTLIPPKPWSSPRSGGYHFPEIVGQHGFVKTRHKQHRELVADMFYHMPAAVDAVNAIQSTPWRINRRVLDVALAIWRDGIAVSGIPLNASVPLPPKPHDIDQNPEARRRYKRDAFKVHDFNARALAGRLQVAKTISIAEAFADEPRMYFPHCVDFRGRAYPIPSALTPQGPDVARGLLEFADGKPIETAEAARWLHVHTANCYGMDKLPLRERSEWVFDNRPMIEAIAADPHRNLEWAKADSPFQFLAACFALSEYWNEPYSVCHIPIAMDATCSGIQHFSAMALDQIGGRAVNLVPTGKREDIYSEVLDEFLAILRALAHQGQDEAAWHSHEGFTVAVSWAAEWWLSLDPDRSLTKRPVMVLPYGGKFRSTMEYVYSWLLAERVENMPWPTADNFKAAHFGAKVLWAAMDAKIDGARRVMTFCHACAKALDDQDDPVVWVTPTGFPVMMAYYDQRFAHVTTALGNERVRIYMPVDAQKKDRMRTHNAIAPNFVHSMDAAHLALTTVAAREAGIRHFAMIHDSFGVHAADADKLSHILRKTFAEMYADDILERFRLDLMDQATTEGLKKFPPPFSRGRLDINQVCDSPYFFS